MTVKNHLIKSFRVSSETWQSFNEACEKTSLKPSMLSRLLFIRALAELQAAAIKSGWENLNFSIKEIS